MVGNHSELFYWMAYDDLIGLPDFGLMYDTLASLQTVDGKQGQYWPQLLEMEKYRDPLPEELEIEQAKEEVKHLANLTANLKGNVAPVN